MQQSSVKVERSRPHSVDDIVFVKQDAHLYFARVLQLAGAGQDEETVQQPPDTEEACK